MKGKESSITSNSLYHLIHCHHYLLLSLFNNYFYLLKIQR